MLLIFVWYSVGRPWIWNSCDVIIDEHKFYGHKLRPLCLCFCLVYIILWTYLRPILI
jgi:hypothetical protein